MPAYKPSQTVDPLDADIDLERVPPLRAAALLAHVSDSSFLAYLFCVLLGRAPDSAGRAHYRQRLAAGLSRQKVAVDLMLSAEFKGRLARLQPTAPRDIQTDDSRESGQAMGDADAGRIGGWFLAFGKGGLPSVARREGGWIGRISGIAQFAVAGAVTRPSLFRRCVKLLRAGEWSPETRRSLMISMLFGGMAFGRSRSGRAIRVPYTALSPRTLREEWQEIKIAPIDPATADRAQIDNWVFQTAYRDARRRALV